MIKYHKTNNLLRNSWSNLALILSLFLFTGSGYTNSPPKDCETPASVACVYSFTPPVPGCTIAKSKINPNGGWGTIALIENCNSNFAEHDLQIFSTEFGLPQCTSASGCFTKVTDPLNPPTSNCTSSEYALDIEWAHAMAPKAKIILYETSATVDSVVRAAQNAGQLVAQAGGGHVSISYGEVEFPSESNFDQYFQVPGVVFIVSSGDYAAGARYPSSSPYVISAGGTSFIRDANGNFKGEIPWFDTSIPAGTKLSGGTGGPSLYEKRPAFQNSVQKIVGTARGTPDISFLADPRTGVCIYSTVHGPNSGSWKKYGGTSLAAPALAGVLNAANHRAQSTQEELNYIYGSAIKNYHAYWHDIIEGGNGFPSLAGYDFATGLGTPLGYKGK